MKTDLKLIILYNELTKIEKECLEEKFKNIATEEIKKQNGIDSKLEFLRRKYNNKEIVIEKKQDEKSEADLIRETIEENIKKSEEKKNKEKEMILQKNEERRYLNTKIKILAIVLFGIFFTLISSNSEKKKEKYKPIINNWNNLSYVVSDFLKENLKDPSSLEIIEASKVYEKDSDPDSENKKYYQKTTYRAKNSFGGYVIETKTFIIQNNKVIGVI